jgi:mono/diheme cytochrome c family protein
MHSGQGEVTRQHRWAIAAVAGVLSIWPGSRTAIAQDKPAPPAEAPLSPGYRFTEANGEQLFAGVCQGCHMRDGRGASGAGTYPSLVEDKNLEARGYPIYVVIRGQRAMPPVGRMMSNDQVAAVVNYVRTHFGNQYQDAVDADEVKQVRPK